MLLPIADTPNADALPKVTWLLMGVNIAVYLLVSVPLGLHPPELSDPVLAEYLRAIGVNGQVSAASIRENLTAYDLVVFKYGFRPAAASLLTLLSSLFLHGGFFHLAGNMLFLYIFGDNVEYRLGAFSYLLAYLFFGIIATLFFALFVPDSPVPLIGASGAISGLMGCYFLWFPRNRVKVLVLLFPFLITTLMVPARWVLGFFLVIDNLLPFFALGSSGKGVAYGAHIGGFLAGLGLVWGIDRANFRFTQQEKAPAWTREPPCTPQSIPQAVAAGELEAASRCYLGLDDAATRLAVPPETALLLGEFLADHDASREALKVFRRFIAERPNSPGIDRAYLGAGQILLQQPRYAISAYHYFLNAIELSRSPDVAGQARAGLARIEEMQRRNGRPLVP